MKIKQAKSITGRQNQKISKTENDKYFLRLYIAGQTLRAVTALKNLKLICEEQLKGKYNIEVIDLLKNPQMGRDDQVIAIPTLIRKLPKPVKLIIGDLSNTERVLTGLDLRRHRVKV